MYYYLRQANRNTTGKYFVFVVMVVILTCTIVEIMSAKDNVLRPLILEQYDKPRNNKITGVYQTSRILKDQASSAEELYMQPETARMSDRLTAAMNRCEEYARNSNISDMKVQGYAWIYTPKNLAYCVTPKVGCTFWKRIFRFLGKDYSGTNVSRPSDIDRMKVHYGRLENIQQRHLSNPIVRTLLSQRKVNAFMFSRDPYSRLWSAYVDKYFLPDFWRSSGPGIVSKFRTKASEVEKVCGNDASFPEFIRYVINALSNNRNLNEHFNPMYKLCSPCHMNFNVLGKLETFQKDAEYIFNKFGLKDLYEKVSYSIRVDEEVNMLIKYNFDLEKGIRKMCYNRTIVAQRLWKTFQINGYISKDIPFPFAFVQKIVNTTHIAELFNEIVIQTTKEQNVDNLMLKHQKRQFLVEAYQELPVSDLERIPKLFQQDFELFDYDKYPKDIFAGS